MEGRALDDLEGPDPEARGSVAFDDKVEAWNCSAWLSSFGFLGGSPSFPVPSAAFRFAFLDSRGGGSSTLYPSGGDSPLKRRNSIAPCSNAVCTTATFASFLLRKSAGTIQEHFSRSSGCSVSLSVIMHPHAGGADAYKSSATHHYAVQLDHMYHHDLSCTQTCRVAYLARTSRTPCSGGEVCFHRRVSSSRGISLPRVPR